MMLKLHFLICTSLKSYYREDDVAAELAALSMEANKGMKEEEKEEEILPVKKEKKVKLNIQALFSPGFPFLW